MNKDYNWESENHRVVEKHLRDSPKVKDAVCSISRKRYWAVQFPLLTLWSAERFMALVSVELR